MSKSYDNTLEMFADPKPQRKKIMSIVTDSRPMDQPKEPETDHLYQLYSLFVDHHRQEEMAAIYRTGGSATATSRRRWSRFRPTTLRRHVSGETTWRPIRRGWKRSCRMAPVEQDAKPARSCYEPSGLADSSTRPRTQSHSS